MQLARLYGEEQKHREANELLDEILGDSKLATKYRVVALARKCEVLRDLKKTQALTDARRNLAVSYKKLKANNPEILSVIHRVIAEPERVHLEVENGSEKET